MAMEFINGPTLPPIKVTGLRTKSLDMENTPGMIKELTRATGKIITCMVKVYINGPMAESMKETTSTIRNMALVYTLIQMVAHIRVIGQMASSTVRVSSSLPKVTKGKESGMKEREFNGSNQKTISTKINNNKNKCSLECEQRLN